MSASARCQAFLLKYFLPIGLALALLIGLALPGVGKALAAPKVGDWGLVQVSSAIPQFARDLFDPNSQLP